MYLTLIKQNNGCYIDSRQVAEVIGKNHKDLLRDIRVYLKIIGKANGRNFAPVDFFIESSYIDAKYETRPCYLISKMGCELVANKLTGEKGVLFTAAYVTKFNEMEAAERAALESRAVTPQLQVFNTAVKNVLAGFSRDYAPAEAVMEFLRGAYKPFGIEITCDSAKCCFSATDIAEANGMFSSTGKPHGHAAAAIIEKLDIAPEHKSIMPYGLVGISMRYSFYVLLEVREWLVANDYPHIIPHLGREYHAYYNVQLSIFDDDED